MTGTFICGQEEKRLSKEAGTIARYLGWGKLRDLLKHTDGTLDMLEAQRPVIQAELIR